jgi:protein-L-isoaspartate(D-aspartate) O-methyltransferase
MHAYALEMLHDKLKSGNKAMDVGAGSGYLVACMAHMVGEQGHVIGIEYVPELAKHAKQRLETDPDKTIQKMMQEGRIEVLEGDGWQGYEKQAPYAAIHVGAAAETLPENLVKQLENNGRLVIPVGTWDQNMLMVEKDGNGNVTQKSVMGVRYVPLVNPTRSK